MTAQAHKEMKAAGAYRKDPLRFRKCYNLKAWLRKVVRCTASMT